MSKESYQIISTIYRLLGDYDQRQLLEASRQKGLPKTLKFALQSLADESKQGRSDDLFERPIQRPPKAPAKPRRPSGNGHSQTPSLSPNLPNDIYKQNLAEFLSSRSRFKNKAELCDFANELGFDRPVNAKDSRKRVELMITTHALKDMEFRKRLDNLVPNDWSKQTSGWLDLILNPKR